MELVKPEPLIIGGRAHFTLTSYDPVDLTILVPYVTDEEIEYACQATVFQAGGTAQDVHNDIWIASHFEGTGGYDGLRQAVANQLREMSAEMAEEEKVSQASSELAERLVQRVPDQLVEQAREYTAQALLMGAAEAGISKDEYLRQIGMTPAMFDNFVDYQARAAAEGEAAVDAWIANRKLTISDEEIPRYLGVMPSDAERLIAQAKAMGQLQDIRDAALRSKALEIIVAEAHCTYEHETKAQAHQRIQQALQQQAMIESLAQQAQNSAQDNEPAATDSHPHLKLV